MNKSKIENYNLTGSVHTLSIKSPGVAIEAQPQVKPCISSTTAIRDGVESSSSTINPNKLQGDILHFSGFRQVMDTILRGAGIKDYCWTRVDLRLDSYDPEHYRAYAKLNRYLISLLAVTYATKNNYRTTNLFTGQQLSVAVKNDYFECENYDRAAKSELTENHLEPAQARLEERTTSRSWRKIYDRLSGESNMDLLQREFTVGWFTRWDKALKNVELVWQRYNMELERIYNEDKTAYPKRFRSLTDFLIQYQDCIFCKAQMVDLLSRFQEVKDPDIRAKNHKKKYGIEYFSQQDLQQAVAEVKRATLAYFET